MARKKNRKKELQANLRKTFLSIVILVFLVGLAAALAHYFIIQKHRPPAAKKTTTKEVSPKSRIPKKPQKPRSKRPEVEPKKPVVKKPLIYEIFPKEPQVEPPTVLKKPHFAMKPKVAIIADDLGYDVKICRDLLDLGMPITFSLLPYSPYLKKIAEMAHKRGVEIMLHLPMEPEEYPRVNPGPGTLLTGMKPDELLLQLRREIDQIPYISGVNNHMGSKMTADEAKMNQIFTILKKERLFFVDSRTTTKTLARHSAKLFQVPFAERSVFLDHIPEEEFIRKQVKRLIQIAGKKKKAVGIIHPHNVTLRVLKKMLPQIREHLELVPVSQLVEIPG